MRHYRRWAAKMVVVALPLLPLVSASSAAPADPAGAERKATTFQVATEPILKTQVVQNDPHRIGKRYAARLGCAACHSLDGGSGIGPTWKGLFGSKRLLADGTTLVADEVYLRRAILDPDTDIADGFAKGIMPTDFGDTLTDKKLIPIIDLIKSIGE